MHAAICCLNSKYIHSSLAPWCLYAGVRAYCTSDITAQVVEGTINEQEDAVIRRVLEQKADVIGFCTYIWNVQEVLSIAQKLRMLNPTTTIVLGGPEVSYRAEDVLSRYDFVDYVISGEGEHPFAELLNALACRDTSTFSKIGGLCFRQGTDYCIAEPFIPTEDPISPYCDEFFETLHGRIAYLETSRGCPYSCAFCLSGRCGTARFFDIEEAKRAMLRLANSGTQTIKLVDRTFNAHRRRAYELIQFIIENYGKEIPDGVCFHFEIAGDILDDAMLDLLATAPTGSIQLEIGLQSFNEKTLSYIHRKTNTARLTQNICRLLEPRNIHIHIDLIAGLPYEDMKSFAESFNQAFWLQPDMLQFGFLKLLYGAPMREDIERYPCTFSEDPPYEVQSTPWLTWEELQKMHRMEDAFDRIYNSGRFCQTTAYALRQSGSSPFAFFADFADWLQAQKLPPHVSLDVYSQAFYAFLCTLNGVDQTMLRDRMVLDRLASNASGVLPKFLQVPDTRLKQVRSILNADERTRAKTGVKRSVAILYHRQEAIYVDYIACDRVTGLFPIQTLSLEELEKKQHHLT